MRIWHTQILALAIMAVAVVGSSGRTARALGVFSRAAAGSVVWQVLTVNPHRPTQIHSGGGPLTIAVDGHGDIYVTDSSRRIQKFSPEGRLLWSAEVPHPRPDRCCPDAIAVDRWGSIYLADAAVVKVSPSGRVLARWGTGPLAHPLGVATGGRGNVFALYATGLGARIEKLSPQGRVLATWYTAAGRNFYAAFPTALAVDPSGNVYVTMLATPYCYQLQCSSDSPQHFLLQKLSPTGKLIATWGGKQACCWPIFIGNSSSGLAVDARGNVYLAGQDPVDDTNHVEKVSPTGTVVARWGEPGCGPVQFDGKLSVAVDGHGTIYVADWALEETGEPGLIHVLAPDGTPRSLWGTCPDKPPRPLRRPSGVAVDARGAVYVINWDRSDVSSGFSPAGTWLTQWQHAYVDENGDPIPLMLTVTAAGGHDVYVGGTLRQSGIAMIERTVRADHPPIFWRLPPPAGQAQAGIQEHVRGLAVAKQNAIYVVSERAGRSRLLRLAPDRKSWAQWDRWIGPSGSIDLWGAAVDRQGNVYVADAGNHCIQKLSPAGEPLACLKGDARYIAVDSQGNIYLSGGDRVHKLSATGALLATWDTKGTAPGQFKGPMGIAVDTHDNVYVADSGNNRIQKLAVSG